MAESTTSGSMPPITEDTNVKTNLKTIAAVIGVVGLAVYSWASVKSDINGLKETASAHDKQLSAIQAEQASAHDILIELRGALRSERRNGSPTYPAASTQPSPVRP